MSPSTWPCGTPKSSNNAFTNACLEDRPPAVLRAKSGPKAKGIATGANATSSLTRGRTTRECRPSDCARTTKIMRASI